MLLERERNKQVLFFVNSYYVMCINTKNTGWKLRKKSKFTDFKLQKKWYLTRGGDVSFCDHCPDEFCIRQWNYQIIKIVVTLRSCKKIKMLVVKFHDNCRKVFLQILPDNLGKIIFFIFKFLLSELLSRGCTRIIHRCNTYTTPTWLTSPFQVKPVH